MLDRNLIYVTLIYILIGLRQTAPDTKPEDILSAISELFKNGQPNYLTFLILKNGRKKRDQCGFLSRTALDRPAWIVAMYDV